MNILAKAEKSARPADAIRTGIIWMMQWSGLGNSNNQDWQLCQQHNQPIELFSIEIFVQQPQYIHNDPVEAGFIENVEHYLCSSARDFKNKKG